MSEAVALERWAFLGRLPPEPNRVTLALAGEDKAPRKAPRPWPKIDDSAFDVGRPYAEYAGSSKRAEIIEMLLDDLAMAGEPFPPWFEEEIDYQMGEAADPIERLPEGLAPEDIERLPEGLASGHVLDIGDEAFVGE